MAGFAGSGDISFAELQKAFKGVLKREASPEELEDILHRNVIKGSKEISMEAFEREMTAQFQVRSSDWTRTQRLLRFSQLIEVSSCDPPFHCYQ